LELAVDIVSLPVLDANVSPGDALGALVSAKRSAALMRVGSTWRMVTSTAIRKALNHGAATIPATDCEEVPPLFTGSFENGYTKLQLPGQAFNTVRDHLYQTFPGQPHRRIDVEASLRPLFEMVLAALPSGYALIGNDRGAAVLLSRHETALEEYVGPPKGCCCRNPDYPHEYDSGTVKPGSICGRCSPPAYVVDC
jgi:hypothetical protein